MRAELRSSWWGVAALTLEHVLFAVTRARITLQLEQVLEISCIILSKPQREIWKIC